METHRKLLWAVLIALVLVGGFMTGFLLFHESDHSGGHGTTGLPQPPPAVSRLEEIYAWESPPPEQSNAPATLQGKDGSILRLIPGNTTSPSHNRDGDSTGEGTVEPFYMDETKVTNIQYVEFLNHVLPRLKVERGVVRGDGRIWLLLGEVTQDCDPIGFENGRFFVKEPAHASCPVLRVTPYGALAYARFYGRRLPTEAEWMHALTEEDRLRGKAPQEQIPLERSSGGEQCPLTGSVPTPAAPQQEELPICSPVKLFKHNSHGIHGLNIGGEWGLRAMSSPESASPEQQEEQWVEFLALGGFKRDDAEVQDRPAALKRYPWEAFEEVGFRTVLSARKRTD